MLKNKEDVKTGDEKQMLNMRSRRLVVGGFFWGVALTLSVWREVFAAWRSATYARFGESPADYMPTENFFTLFILSLVLKQCLQLS